MTGGMNIFSGMIRITRISNYLGFLYTNRQETESKSPDIVFVYKQKKNCLIIVIPSPGDIRVDIKQEEKVNKYLDLAVEIKEL